MTEENKNDAKVNADEHGEGQVIGRLVPADNIHPDKTPGGNKASAKLNQAFEQAFYDTLERKGEGLLTKYLYHDPSKDDGLKDKKKVSDMLDKHFGQFLYGARAWDANTQRNKFYGLVSGDMEALDYAIEHHIVTKLPENMHLIDYGSGGETGAHKSAKLIQAIRQDNTHDISGYTAIDIVPRFASESATTIYNEFNLHADMVICDFMGAEKVLVPKIKNKENYTPLSLIFGGTLANAPDASPGGGNDSKQNAITCLSRMNKQHGTGSEVLLVFHSENDPKMLSQEYQSTDELSAFVLSSFSRAVMQGTITDSGYDPFRYWSIEPRYDANTKALKMCAVAREDHTIPTAKGQVSIKKDEAFTSALSYKWDENDYSLMLKQAGYEIIEIFRKEGAPRGAILARALPSPELPAPLAAVTPLPVTPLPVAVPDAP